MPGKKSKKKKKKTARKELFTWPPTWSDRIQDLIFSCGATGHRNSLEPAILELLGEAFAEVDKVKAELAREKEKPPKMVVNADKVTFDRTNSEALHKLDAARQFFDHAIHHEIQVHEDKTPLMSSSSSTVPSYVGGLREIELTVVSKLTESQMVALQQEFSIGRSNPFDTFGGNSFL